MSPFDIEILSCLTFVAASKFLHHSIVVGRIVAGDVTNLWKSGEPEIWERTTIMVYLMNNAKAVANLEESLA